MQQSIHQCPQNSTKHHPPTHQVLLFPSPSQQTMRTLTPHPKEKNSTRTQHITFENKSSSSSNNKNTPNLYYPYTVHRKYLCGHTPCFIRLSRQSSSSDQSLSRLVHEYIPPLQVDDPAKAYRQTLPRCGPCKRVFEEVNVQRGGGSRGKIGTKGKAGMDG